MTKHEITLKNILENDPLNLLKTQPKKSGVISSDERLVNSFEEINSFIETQDREPKESTDIEEFKLYSRLQGLRKSPERIAELIEHDRFQLFKGKAPEKIETPNTVENILDADPLGLLSKDSSENDIFTLKNIPHKKKQPDYFANRKQCQNFNKFENIFIQCQLDLKLGKRKLRSFSGEQNITKGHFFILKGVMVYINKVGTHKIINGKNNARLHCIFENGTESDMLLRSLSAELYKDGRRVTEHEDLQLSGFNNISEEDSQTGYIYILKSKSEKPEIKKINDLYKIGYSSSHAKDRIRNAEQDPTFLMADVAVISEFKCYNLNSQKLELLIHKFFAKTCLNIDVFDNKGLRHTPREWFVVPLAIIEEAIHYIIDETIVNFKYNLESKLIEKK
ncbi:MAG: GIY-YIG nuclease family protein [Bdellovibrionales bacterium]|nr:GIY-YIG nuclease family protein [Bdellovibrionales bacterium]